MFPTGKYEINDSIALPKNWAVILKAGAQLYFEDGALLKIVGPLTVAGTENEPVIMNVKSNETFGEMGSWGGILVAKAKQRSRIEYLTLNGSGIETLKNRQGYFGMTGCLSFYESDVDIRNTKFFNAQCEDALNIMKADFTIKNMHVERASFDAFDSDFSTGKITNSTFVNIGNDGIDLSGTVLDIKGIQLEAIGDKAISVGEKSTLVAEDIDIDGSVLGLVAKDLSRIEAENVRFKGIKGTALLGYIKKAEYGPSHIECTNCNFTGSMEKAGQQQGSTITLNGKQILTNKLSPNQMRDAGLIENELIQ